MTTTITARGVNEALSLGIMNLARGTAHQRESRNGPVLEVHGPVITEYLYPDERVLFHAARDANPFFHFFESLWMLAGCEDVEFVSWFNSRIKDYSDDGVRFHGAYGRRWRHHFGHDQLETCIQLLINEPDTRRAVLCMWDPVVDLNRDKKDIPCNDLIFFKRLGAELRMTLCCRSNDAIWGAFGANAVHMSMLMEYVAGRVGCTLGSMTQVSDSLHVYTDNPQWKDLREMAPGGRDLYKDSHLNGIKPYPIMDAPEFWDRDLEVFMKWLRSEWPRDDFDGSPEYPYANKWFTNVAEPMAVVWALHKSKAPGGGLALVEQIQATDWQLACIEWLERRETNAT